MKTRSKTATAIASLVATLSLLASLTACGSSKPAPTPSAEGVSPAAVVQAYDNGYKPKTVTVKVGEAVKWEFTGTAKHDVIAADGSFVSELMQTGNYTHVFAKAGTYEYKCSVHPEMRGTVVVTE
ncbi:cupredoxin domain-containing protein [Canibacter sp. lx-45]|uniref:cupredoxin domain-containing protein n=1 Tax=Canibacter zhuwentaonis TaxID=2837491 RepID=UPI001BDD0C1B|nr:cupredoxin domain-containing protein [Canibacter zhuwentaonis]MBT1035743.1 cupredoxin domain-containing protein [Canibacter zhuwentaonis]